MKKWITVSLVLLFAGLGLICLGLLLPGGLQSSDPYVQEQAAYSGNLTEIRLNGGSAAVSVIQSDTSDVVIETDTPQSQPFTFREQNGRLSIARTDLRAWYQFIGVFDFHRTPYNIRIALPEGFAGSVILETASGDIRISDVAIGGTIHISTSSGYLRADCLETASFSFTASSGDAIVTSLTCAGDGSMRSNSGMLDLRSSVLHGNLELSSSSGDQRLNQLTADGELISSRSSGDLTARNVTCQRFSARSASGDLVLENTAVNEDVLLEQSSGDVNVCNLQCRNLSAECQSGDIRLTELEVGSMELQAASGDAVLREAAVSGPVTIRTRSGNVNCRFENAASEFTIQTDTHSGNRHIPPAGGSGAYQMRISTTSGDITLQFAS